MAENPRTTGGVVMSAGYAVHRDKPDCDCGRCEPAAGGNMMGALMSGNPACDAPSCIILGFFCRWGDQPCMDLRALPD